MLSGGSEQLFSPCLIAVIKVLVILNIFLTRILTPSCLNIINIGYDVQVLYSPPLPNPTVFLPKVTRIFGPFLLGDCRGLRLVMSTIPKWKHKRSNIEAKFRNGTKTFCCVPKKEVEHFYLVQKLWIKIITFFMCSRTFKIEIRTFLCILEHLNQNQNILMCSRIF